MPKYEDIFTISKFAGINQACDGDNINPAYAVLGSNFDTAHGGLKAFNCVNLIPGTYTPPGGGRHYDPEEYIDHSIPLTSDGPDDQILATLMFLHKRWTLDTDVVVRADKYNNTFQILIVDHKIYWRRMTYGQYAGVAWQELLNPETGESFYFSDNRFDWVSYEMNYLPPETLTDEMCAAIRDGDESYVIFDATNGFNYYKVESTDGLAENATYTDNQGTSHTVASVAEEYRLVRRESPQAPIDCLLFTNDTAGMWCIWSPLNDDNELGIAPVHVGPRDADSLLCNCISRHYDRIWVAGISTDPDKCMYSVVRDAFNWEQDDADPANGAGDIQQPTWDGDEIAAIKEFGNHLLVVKHNSIWRILGATPDEYQYKKQFGEGTIAEDTFAVNGSVAYMLTDDDVKIYDGNSTRHFKYGAIKDLLLNMFLEVGQDKYVLYEGRMLQDKYVLYTRRYLSNGMPVAALVVYDTVEGTVNIQEVPELLTFEVDNNKLYGVYVVGDLEDTSHPIPDTDPVGYYTTFIQMGEFFTQKYSNDNMRGYTDGFKPHTTPVTWESAWLDLGAKNAIKSGFNVYLLFKPVDELTAEQLEIARVTCTVTVRSEKKTKSKTVTVPFNKMKRVRVNLNARAFRLRLEIPKNEFRWRIGTGVNVYLEYDAD